MVTGAETLNVAVGLLFFPCILVPVHVSGFQSAFFFVEASVTSVHISQKKQ